MSSKGEQKIAQILKANHIKFKQEVSFPDLNGFKGLPLRFDFIVYDDNNRIVCAIEADGKQHFQFTRYFHKTILDFKKTQEYDRKKNSYCLAKGIPLIRIPYWDYDNLTLKSILTNPAYRVVNKFHTDLLMRR